MEDEDIHVVLRLSAQRALLGEIVPSIRGIAVDYDQSTIFVYYYNDGEIDDDLYDDFTSIATEILASFSSMMIEEKIVNLPFPEALPSHRHWVYMRKENRDLLVRTRLDK